MIYHGKFILEYNEQQEIYMDKMRNKKKWNGTITCEIKCYDR
jgi:hypothetical protein